MWSKDNCLHNYSTTQRNMEELNVDNYVTKIKAMSERERSKIQIKRLLEIICQVPDLPNIDVPAVVSTQIDELRGSIRHINEMATRNSTELQSLKIQNEDLLKSNIALKAETDLLKIHARECKENRQPTVPLQRNNNDDIVRIDKEIAELKDELNSVQQYLRVNNLEVVGLPDANANESEEALLVNAFNQLQGMDEIVRPEDIDISHPLPSNRKDNKQVHVVRFISRKTKFMILNAKKQEENRQFKFRGNDVFINEHLSKNNRSLFAEAQAKKKLLKYKYCWTRAGSIFMRKTDDSEVVTITCRNELNDLV